MPGTSGNAGLFSTALDLSVYCRMVMGHGLWKGKRVLSREAVEVLTAVQTHGHAYGFDVASSYAWIKGMHVSEQAFCHSGYTGVSVVCGPAVQIYLIILTNRVHLYDAGTCKLLRREIAEIVLAPPVHDVG